MWFGGGGKKPISSILPEPLLGGALLEKHFYPKQVVKQPKPIDACQRDWLKETQGLTIQRGEKDTWQNEMGESLL